MSAPPPSQIRHERMIFRIIKRARSALDFPFFFLLSMISAAAIVTALLVFFWGQP